MCISRFTHECRRSDAAIVGVYLDARPARDIHEAAEAVWNTRTLTAEIARKDEAMLTDVSEMRFHRNGSVIGSTFQGQWWIGKAAGQFATALDAYKSLAVPNGEA
jgi:hypothetical protein